MAESQATHKLHDINDLAVYVMQSEAKDLCGWFSVRGIAHRRNGSTRDGSRTVIPRATATHSAPDPELFQNEGTKIR